MTDSLESELVRRATAGDTVAVTMLLTQTHARLRAHMESRIPQSLRASLDVDDLIQETQIQVYRHVQTFVPQGPNAFYRWTATIALRRLRNAIKACRSQKRGGGQTLTGASLANDGSIMALLDLMSGPEKTPSHHAARHEALAAMTQGLELLPEHYREAVRLVYLEGLGVAEAAALMGRTPRAIHNLCHKAKELLRGILGSSSRFLSSS